MSRAAFIASVRRQPAVATHRHRELLLELLLGDTHLTASGYPYITDAAFIGFLRRVPHLFADGLAILDWADAVEPLVAAVAESELRSSLERALQVLRAMVQTAAITSPSDLWLLRQVLSEHARLGILADLLAGRIVDPAAYAAEHGLDRRQLKIDFHFLFSRGYLDYEAPCFMAPPSSQICAGLEHLEPLPPAWRIDWVERWVEFLRQGTGSDDLRQWLSFPADTGARGRITWIPTLQEIEIGYRLVPMVLALRALDFTPELVAGRDIAAVVPRLFDEAITLLTRAGCVRDGRITAIGGRVFERAPGPFGIIYTYHPYTNHLADLLSDRPERAWVRRGQNVAASQDANRKTFRLANRALDAFCRDTGFRFHVFIEHAVGKGEAVRQRFAQDGEEHIRYFGADLEDAAIDETVAEQRKGLLPTNMEFIRGADIGRPEKVIAHLRQRGVDPRGAVMMVGNGFHEIRDQTNERMIETFRGYAEAGVLILFTEETGLTDDDLRATAWNTYHAGFRYVHEMSGQGLRPSWDLAYRRRILWSWRRCAEKAGYRVLDKYTHGTRPIYPTRKPNRENPSISVTYFCLPQSLEAEHGLAAPAETRRNPYPVSEK